MPELSRFGELGRPAALGRFEPTGRSEPVRWTTVAGTLVKVGQRQHSELLAYRAQLIRSHAGRHGAPQMSPARANRDWPGILARAGLAPRRPYQTRHTAETLMLAAGENPAWIAQVLVHADCQMLWRTYARYLPNLTRQDGAAFAATVARVAA